MTIYDKDDLIYKITSELSNLNIEQSHIDFIERNIHLSDKNQSMWFTPYNMNQLLEERQRGLSIIFHKVSNECGIRWSPTNSIEESDFTAYDFE